MPPKPLITVVTVSYNCVDSIERTILSVLDQTYSNVEYIIIDGGSNDGTVDVIQKYNTRIAYWISEPDGGIYDAMNKGLAKSSGEWVNFLNSGDVYYDNETLANISVRLLKYTDVALVFGNVTNMYQGNIGVYKKDVQIWDRKLPFNICHQSVFYNVSIFKEIGYDLKYKYCADSKSYYDLLCNGCKFHYEPIAISVYDASSGVSSKNLIKVLKEKTSILKLKPNDSLWWELNIKYRVRYIVMKILGGQAYNFLYSRYSKLRNK